MSNLIEKVAAMSEEEAIEWESTASFNDLAIVAAGCPVCQSPYCEGKVYDCGHCESYDCECAWPED